MLVTGDKRLLEDEAMRQRVILAHVFAVQLQHRAAGIRIEDDARVTANGCELISQGVPAGVDEIETLMRGWVAFLAGFLELLIGI